MGVKFLQAGLTVGSVVAFVVAVTLMITTGDSPDPQVNLQQFIECWACLVGSVVMGCLTVHLGGASPIAEPEPCNGR